MNFLARLISFVMGPDDDLPEPPAVVARWRKKLLGEPSFLKRGATVVAPESRIGYHFTQGVVTSARVLSEEDYRVLREEFRRRTDWVTMQHHSHEMPQWVTFPDTFTEEDVRRAATELERRRDE